MTVEDDILLLHLSFPEDVADDSLKNLFVDILRLHLMLSLVIIDLLVEALIPCLELLSEQIILELFLVAVVVIRRDTVHDQLDFLDGALRSADLAPDLLSLFAQFGPLLVVFLQPAAAIISAKTGIGLGGPALKVAIAAFTVIVTTSVSITTAAVVAILVATFTNDFYRILDFTLDNDLGAAVLDVLGIDLLGLADLKLAEFEEKSHIQRASLRCTLLNHFDIAFANIIVRGRSGGIILLFRLFERVNRFHLLDFFLLLRRQLLLLRGLNQRQQVLDDLLLGLILNAAVLKLVTDRISLRQCELLCADKFLPRRGNWRVFLSLLFEIATVGHRAIQLMVRDLPALLLLSRVVEVFRELAEAGTTILLLIVVVAAALIASARLERRLATIMVGIPRFVALIAATLLLAVVLFRAAVIASLVVSAAALVLIVHRLLRLLLREAWIVTIHRLEGLRLLAVVPTRLLVIIIVHWWWSPALETWRIRVER